MIPIHHLGLFGEELKEWSVEAYTPLEDLKDGVHVVGLHLKYRLLKSLHEVPQRFVLLHLNVLQGAYILLLTCRT